MSARALLYVFIAYHCVLVTSFSSPVWLSECKSHGFLAGQLPCSTCAKLEGALGAEHSRVAACHSCCSAQLDYEDRRFEGAVLRVCRAQATGGVQEWLEKRAEAWAARGVVVEDTCAALAGLGAGMGGFGSMGGFGGMPGMGFPGSSEPPTLVLLSGGDAASPPPQPSPLPGAARAAKGGAAKRRGAPAKEEAPAPPAGAAKKGVELGVQAFKVEQIDAFLEKHLVKGTA